MAASSDVFAQYSSPNYKANEVFFGAGGDNNQSSTNYRANASLGALGVGRASSSTYQAYSGFLTPNEPFLELGVDTTLVDLGVLDTTSTKTGNALFHVRAYLDSGYTVKTVSQPPSMTSGTGSHTLSSMSYGLPSTGTEEFGVNLVHNTAPVAFGNDPSPQPNSTYATGQATSGYDTANHFQYNIGDSIAQTSGSGWGATNYTISYVANAGLLTPAGNYTMVHDLVAVATY